MNIHAYCLHHPNEPLVPFSFDAKPPGPREVLIKITCCSVCHSDLHLIANDWGISKYPLVPGHEIVGDIIETGSGITSLKTGDTVGVGWQSGACGRCRTCKSGEPQLCAEKKRRTCVDGYGGFASHIIIHEDFAVKIPKELPPGDAAPLMCAGGTVFTPLRRHKIRTGKKVLVVGFGGLGHLAVQFAHAMGAHVGVMDPDPGKEHDAHSYGAEIFMKPEDAAHHFRDFQPDFILTTTSANLDWNGLMAGLDLNGTLCLVGIPPDNITVAPDHLLDGQKTLTGSVIASPAGLSEMLQFAAEHRIKPATEDWPMHKVNDALDAARKGLVRYRAVLWN